MSVSRGPNQPEQSPDVGEPPVMGPEAPERLWTIRDVSAFLGVPVGTLYQWRQHEQGPPAMRMGKHLRFDPVQVRAWAAAQVA